MCTRPARKTLVLNTICTVCSTQKVYYTCLLCVKYGMHAYAGPACICRMHAPSMLFPPTQCDVKDRQKCMLTVHTVHMVLNTSVLRADRVNMRRVNPYF